MRSGHKAFGPLPKKQYAVYKRRVTRCLMDVLGYSEDQAKLFSLQTFRRTGDSLMFKAGKSPHCGG